jgi:hypothetical protein
MKPRTFRWLLGIVFLSWIACSKELSRENGTVPTSGDFYATLDGKLWNADSLQLVFGSNGGVSINGLSRTGDQISMNISSFAVGTYTLSSSSTSYAFYTNILATTPAGYLSNTGTAGGTVIISAIDTINHLISGSFSFTLVNPVDNTSKTITAGVFDYIPYSGSGVTVVTPPTGGSLDTLEATVGSASFNAALVQAQAAGTQLVIAGVSSDGKQNLDLLFPSAIQPGTYQLDYGTGVYGAVYYTDVSNPMISNANGTLIITSNNTTTKTVKGTFSFVASTLDNSQSLNITNGYFSVNY